MMKPASITETLISDLRRARTPNVLVIEDDSFDSQHICTLLGDIGCNTCLARDGRQAIDVLKLSLCPDRPDFDIAFLDLHLPLVSGVEVLKYIRANSVLLPVIIVTVNQSDYELDMLSDMGYIGVIRKPVRRSDLEEALHKHKIQFDPRTVA